MNLSACVSARLPPSFWSTLLPAEAPASPVTLVRSPPLCVCLLADPTVPARMTAVSDYCCSVTLQLLSETGSPPSFSGRDLARSVLCPPAARSFFPANWSSSCSFRLPTHLPFGIIFVQLCFLPAGFSMPTTKQYFLMYLYYTHGLVDVQFHSIYTRASPPTPKPSGRVANHFHI